MSDDLGAFKRVIVTGSGGVLGYAIKERLRAITDIESLFVERRDCDLCNSAEVQNLFGEFRPELVFHLAGKVFGVQGNKDFCGEVFLQNVQINTNVIEASRRCGAKKIVAAGTAAIYSDQVKLPMREEDLWFGAPHGSEAPYGHAKRAMLAHLEAYKAQYDLDFAYLILTNLYGPNDRFDQRYGHVVPSLISKFMEAKVQNLNNVTCWGDGTPTRDFLFSSDAANAFVLAAAKGVGPMNVATGNPVTIQELVTTISRLSGFEGCISWDKDKPLGQLQRAYDVTKMLSLGWSPKKSLSEGINETLGWYKVNSSHLRDQ